EYGTPIYPNELDKDVKKHIGSYVENIVNETIHKNAELLKN
ncbi:MAG: 1-acyl-sn-glycerol-3-phosphate acyltransferase, partial [Mediterraneibacter faecis]|nr:1-acyl-sn-glycerol-3-phosphate acyltransferase [Mediterraneibacter faecis]